MTETGSLRSAQAPLKQRYRDEPDTATVTLHAEGVLGEEDLTCSVQTGQAVVKAGLHPGTGGDGLSACSGDLLLQALVACAGVTLRAVASSLGIEVSGTVRAEGDLDFRGTLAVSKEVPVGFSAIRLYLEVDTPASGEEQATLLRLTERYCVVYQTLAGPPALSARITGTPRPD